MVMPDSDTSPTQQPLRGLRVLVVEDEFLIAHDISRILHSEGCEVLGPVPVVSAAEEIVMRGALDGAVLDVNLRGDLVFPLAQKLLVRRVPILFTTGYDRDNLPEAFSGCPMLQKPFRARRLRELARQLFPRSSTTPPGRGDTKEGLVSGSPDFQLRVPDRYNPK
jgi:DNA-binding response OmpR family regulator